MTPIQLAIEIKETVKQCVPVLGRSDNKIVNSRLLDMKEGAKYYEKKLNIGFAIGELRGPGSNYVPRAGKATYSEVIAYGGKVMSNGHGNCTEVSAAAMFCLKKRKKESTLYSPDMVYYTGGGDHVFVVIGQASHHGEYPRSFAAWSDTAAICDVWADVACPAPEYPARWRARIQNFHSMGYLLGNASADQSEWVQLVDQSKKSFFG